MTFAVAAWAAEGRRRRESVAMKATCNGFWRMGDAYPRDRTSINNFSTTRSTG